MEKKEQIRNLQKIATTYKVPTDLIDFESLVDSKLSYEENKNIVLPMIEMLAVSQNEVTEKIEKDYKRKGNIKSEKESLDKDKLEQIKREQEQVKKEFDESINSIKTSTTDILEKAFFVPTKLITTLSKSDKISGFIWKGGAGLGKSFNTIKILLDLGLKQGKDFEILNSFVTPLELYTFLYDNKKDKTLILDDTMGFFNNKTNIGLILSALWGSTDNTNRIVQYNSTSGRLKVPTSCLFTSKIIWCVNDVPKELEAVKSRCFFYDMEFSYQEKLELICEITKLKKADMEIVDFIKDNSDENTPNLDLRLVDKINEIKENNPTCWKDIAVILLGKDKRLTLLKKLLDECNNLKEVEKKWCNETELSRASFFRIKNKLGVRK
jgi:hypothetical protein